MGYLQGQLGSFTSLNEEELLTDFSSRRSPRSTSRRPSVFFSSSRITRLLLIFSPSSAVVPYLGNRLDSHADCTEHGLRRAMVSSSSWTRADLDISSSPRLSLRSSFSGGSRCGPTPTQTPTTLLVLKALITSTLSRTDSTQLNTPSRRSRTFPRMTPSRRLANALLPTIIHSTTS